MPKTELVHNVIFTSKPSATFTVAEWIEVFYNGQRGHSMLGHVAPAVFERRYYDNLNAASAAEPGCLLFRGKPSTEASSTEDTYAIAKWSEEPRRASDPSLSSRSKRSAWCSWRIAASALS